ncbi:hypothetical protein GQ43DRAFT_368576 [Delitschia confertaspora ATCC 74209]|uniref:Zn(2)-C6 fungal-type domain-containing protein n=1 Tax=Delitschia confertaspora ATCC 74209 TaxID=1513339 RepID=A0A9P4JQU2_9PLEO|nr:hypothetical protein GQ43DRAFT_368576 [Delitschia confertaspora ATCC 74209]
MSTGSSDSPSEGFVNDLSHQGSVDSNHRPSSPTSRTNSLENQNDGGPNKPKRIACVLCRRRKLRCDGVRPTCGTCKRLAHDCAYDEVRKKSGPKRGYVKLLEARLHQVEKLLRNQETAERNRDTSHASASSYIANTISQALPEGTGFLGTEQVPGSFSQSVSPGPEAFVPSDAVNNNSTNGDFPWEMIGLGLEEPLPPQEVINDLNQIYFTKVHPSAPIVHKPRFLAAMNLAPHMRPPVCLRYAMWALAATVSDKYDRLHEHFYQRARKYAQMDEMKGHGESTITLAHCQAWILLASYEFKQMYFPRGWLSAGRAARFAQMMQLHRLDGVGLDVKQVIPPPKDWTEREERRRTFWMAFAVDRYASIGTGWPMTIDERDILTNLPASEDAFEKSRPMPTGCLEQAMSGQGASSLHPFGAVVVTAALFGRNLLHLHRPGADDHEHDLNGGFWTRHRNLDNILLSTSLAIPDHLRLPAGLPGPNVVFLNMSIHTSAICLHQAAIFKADKHRLPVHVGNESKVRCVTAAAEIASIMRMISHLDLSGMNPFISFCIYVAARVFVQYLKTRPKDQQMRSSLQFLLQAMQALRRKNPLTESFLVQLDVDIESAGIFGMQKSGNLTAEIPVNTDSVSCSPMFELRESQSATAAVNTFGNGNPIVPSNAPPQYTGNSAGPPFHLTSITTVNMQTQPTYPYARLHQNVSLDLPQRQRATPNGIHSIPGEARQNDSEMDLSSDTNGSQATPSSLNSQSRGGSTPHNSYSPSQQQDDPQNQHLHNVGKAPANMSQPSQMPLPCSSAPNMNENFFSSTTEMFPETFYNNPASTSPNDPIPGNFMTGNEWDMSGGLGAGTGMAPMSEGSWNQMLESIHMGWDAVGSPHDGHAPH